VHHKFAAGVNNTGGNLPTTAGDKFATGANDIGGK
jgi:hypothetical protein